jgi:polyisoprenyl-teichoic acid--peptidoglycan teichoic acid transferase
MNRSLKTFLLSIILLTICTSCTTNSLGNTSIAAALHISDTTPITLVQAPADATPTATPFQPIPPTAVYYPTEAPIFSPTSTPTPVPTPFSLDPAAPVGALQLPPDQINILLLGSDQRPWDSHFRTDTIMLLTLNPSQGSVSLTSFPRDLYINIPGAGMDRINTAWGRGGFNKLAETFQYNFGVKPEHYVLINFSSFKQVIDSLGGLDVNVGQTVSDYRNGYYYTIQAGPQNMDADTVLWYVRTRKTTNDFARARRQQEILMAVFEKMLSLNVLRRIPEFYAIYKDNVTTDLGLTNLVPLFPLAAQLTDTSRIHHYFIGPNQVSDWITPGGGMVLLPQKDAVMNVIRKALNGQ